MARYSVNLVNVPGGDNHAFDGGSFMHSESQWRYRAYRKGLRLVKYKVGSPAFEQYGPYGLVDLSTRTVVATNLDAEAVERELYESDLTTSS